MFFGLCRGYMPSPNQHWPYIAIRITQFWWRLYQTTSGSRDPDFACYWPVLQHLCWSWKRLRYYIFGAAHEDFDKYHRSPCHCPCWATQKADPEAICQGQRCEVPKRSLLRKRVAKTTAQGAAKGLELKKTIETLQTVWGYSEHFRHEGIGISRGHFSFYRPSGGRLERTECSACAEKSCASEGPYRSKAQGAKRITTLDMFDLYPRTSWNSKKLSSANVAVGCCSFPDGLRVPMVFYKRKLPRE